MTHASTTTRRRSGFTLIEILVVIGILALLVGLLTPMVVRTMRRGVAMKTAADLNTIAIALDAYKQDFGDYPRVPYANPAGNLRAIDIGAAVLGKALVGPANARRDNLPTFAAPFRAGMYGSTGSNPETQLFVVGVAETSDPIGTAPDWVPFNYVDGADGPGFRNRRLPGADNILNNDDDTFQGKVWGPYVKPENFRMVGLALSDGEGNPILYFSSSSPNANIQKTGASRLYGGYVSREFDSRGQSPPIVPMYNADNNLSIFLRANETDAELAMARIRAVLGDFGDNGAIDTQFPPAAEQAASRGPFLLWTAGADGQFGPTSITKAPASASELDANRRAVEKCDDVTNFR